MSGQLSSRGMAAVLAAALAAMNLAACTAADPAPDVDRQLVAARDAFVAFDFVAARDGFATALEREPNNAEAAYGLARSLMVLNQYEEALPAFERALELAPDDPRVHEGYLFTLAWGGTLRGRRVWLDRAIESGSETIRRFPERVEPYEMVERAVGELNQPGQWLQILAALEADLDASSVFRIHHMQARLAAARSAGDEQGAAAIEEELGRELAGAAAAEDEAAGAGGAPDAGRRYLLAIGHQLLGDAEAERVWLARLDETPEGRRMGRSRVHFDVYYRDFLQAREAPMEERLQIVERWKERFQPAWETDDITTYRVPLGQELALLIEEARRQRQDAGQPDAEIVERIVGLGEDLARLDTWGGAGYYRQLAQTLIDLDVRLDEALRVADDGIAALVEGRPGLLYPGTREDELERTRDSWISAFERLRGLALVGMDRPEEAEAAFRRAIDIGPRSDRLAALGEFLVGEGRDQEGYESLVAALAHNAEDERIEGDLERVRDAAVAAAARLGHDEAAFEHDLEAARAEVAEEARRRMVADRLDREAPGFALADTEGKEWRLADLQGKVVVLNYWATWCGPCRTEFPHYQELVDSYAAADDVVFLAISTDTDHSVPRAFLDENDYRFTVLFDEGSATDYHVTGIPQHFILGPEGRIQYATGGFSGPERYREEMHARIDALRQR